MRGNWKKYLGVFVPMAVVIAAPMILRDDETVGAGAADLRLEVITPHNEAIRREFGDAFSKWYEKQTGKSVYVNWRQPGLGQQPQPQPQQPPQPPQQPQQPLFQMHNPFGSTF